MSAWPAGAVEPLRAARSPEWIPAAAAPVGHRRSAAARGATNAANRRTGGRGIPEITID